MTSPLVQGWIYATVPIENPQGQSGTGSKFVASLWCRYRHYRSPQPRNLCSFTMRGDRSRHPALALKIPEHSLGCNDLTLAFSVAIGVS